MKEPFKDLPEEAFGDTLRDRRLYEMERLDKYSSDCARNLRIWFVSYGVGVPAFLFLKLNEAMLAEIRAGWGFLFFMGVFFSAVFIQIAQTFLMKHGDWYASNKLLHLVLKQPQEESSWYRKSLIWVCYKYEVVIILDVLTVICFASSTIWAFAMLSLS